MAALREAFQAQVEAIRRHAPEVGPDADPEELHKLRVAIRRMRALLRAAQPLITDERAESIRQELRELGGWIGPARDADVFVSYLREETSDVDEAPDAVAQLLARAEHDRREAYGAARMALDSEAFERLLQELEAFASSVVLRDASMNGLVHTEGRKLRKAMEDISADAALHDARIKAKRVRYAAEVAGSKDVVERAKRLQDVVGEHQDAVVAEERLRALSEPATALLVGRLIERQRARRSSARAEVPKVWRKLARTIR
jgi:CHAD domain-containing protein